MLGTGYPLTSQSNTTVWPMDPAKFLGADRMKGAENEKEYIVLHYTLYYIGTHAVSI